MTPACPRCSAPLGASDGHDASEGITCDAGHGVWMSADALATRLADDTRARFEVAMRAAPVGKLRCAECRRLMRTLVVPGAHGAAASVEVDFCSTCDAFWLDAGELEHVAATPATDAPDTEKERDEGSVPRTAFEATIGGALEAFLAFF